MIIVHVKPSCRDVQVVVATEHAHEADEELPDLVHSRFWLEYQEIHDFDVARVFWLFIIIILGNFGEETAAEELQYSFENVQPLLTVCKIPDVSSLLIVRLAILILLLVDYILIFFLHAKSLEVRLTRQSFALVRLSELSVHAFEHLHLHTTNVLMLVIVLHGLVEN